jgi:uncharacterized protein
MKADEVALYLQQNPEFFQTHAQEIAEIVIPHPHGGRTISLPERQMVALRERSKELEKKLYDLMEFAKENDALQRKLHQFNVALFNARDGAGLQEIVLRNLLEIFAVPHAVLQVWKNQPPSAEMLIFADQQQQPVCVHHAVHDSLAWFGESAAHLHSFAYLPLHDGENSIGLLVLGSEEAQRFYPEMGTVFLQRIADMLSGALRVHV